MTRALAPWLLTATVFAVAIAGYQGYRTAQWMLAPLAPPTDSPPHDALRIVTIPEGATLKHVASLLEREGLIPSRWGFLLLGKVKSADRRLLAGEYAFHPGMRPTDMLADIRSGRVVLHSVTVPEGYTVAQIADLLQQKGLTDGAEFLRLTRDREFIRSLDLDEAGLEGYLFPETYRFARSANPKDVIRAMVTGLEQVFTPAWRDRAKDLGLSMHDVLTLASLIEKETGVEAERELVSAVFHNRLRRSMPLQSDPTVIYGLAQFDGNLRKQDLASLSPYNTYRVAGLPPGPIANPGANSIRAALYPAAVRYLYFVARNDGTHMFSSSLEEHNQAVERYQKRPGNRPRARG
jgi:UPF0755 protein